MSTRDEDVPVRSVGAALPSTDHMSSAAQSSNSSLSTTSSANPTSSASQSANPTSSIFSVVEASFGSSGKSRKKFSLIKPVLLRQSRESQTYVVVSHDIYVLHRPTKDPAPTKLYDFRGSQRFEILRGSCSVTRRVGKDACKLRVTYPEHSRPSNRNRDVLTLIFDNEAQMSAFAEIVEHVVSSLEKLQAAVEAKQLRLKADTHPHGEDSESQCEILKYLNIRPASSVTVDELDKFNRVTERLKKDLEAVASGTALAAPLLAVLESLPVVGPFMQLVCVVGELASSEVDRSDMKEEMKKLCQECGEVTQRVFSLLSSGFDMKHVEDDVVKDLFKLLERSLDTGRDAEHFIMSIWLSQYADIEKVKGYTGKMNQAWRDIQLLHIKVNSNRQLGGQSDMRKEQKEILEGQSDMRVSSEENHNMAMQRFDRIDHTLQVRTEVTITFRRNDLVGARSVCESMNWAEGSGTPESELKKKLISNENSSQGLIGVIGMSGVGKSTMLNCVVHMAEVKDWYTGGIYCIYIGQGCDERKVITEIARVVQETGSKDRGDEITKKENVREAVSVAKPWFAKQRCLLVLDDLCTTKNSSTGFVNDVRGILDVESGSRVVFSSRYKALRDVADDGDYVNVKEREADGDAARGILCRHAQIDKVYIDNLPKRARSSEKDKKSYDAFRTVLNRCNGFPLSLAVAGKTVARLARNGPGGSSASSAVRVQYFQHLHTEGRWRALDSDIVAEHGMEGYMGFSETVEQTWQALEKVNEPVEGHDISKMRRLFSGLLVFGQQEQVPLHVARKLWGLESDYEAEQIANWLSETGLVGIWTTPDAPGMASIRVHDLIQKVCIRIAKDLGMSEKDWHRELLDRYATSDNCNQEWWRCKGIDDGYMRDNLRRHLVAGGLWEELGELLVDFRWIKNRLQGAEGEERGPNALQEEILSLLRDYEALTTHVDDIHSSDSDKRRQGDERDVSDWDGVDLIAEALRLSGETLRSDPAQVGSQLHGRLFTPRCLTAVGKFLDSLERYQDQPWIRTIRPCLTMAGDALRKRFSVPSVSESGEYLQVKYIPNSRELLLSSRWSSRVFLVIDIESERITRRLVFTTGLSDSDPTHSSEYSEEYDDGNRFACRVVSRDGRYVVAGRGDSIHLWDLTKKGNENHSEVFRMNDEVVVAAVDVTPDTRHVIMGFTNGALSVWDINKRKVLGGERACPGLPVNCVVVSPSGSRIASLSWSWGSLHRMVHVWKLSEDGTVTQQAESMMQNGKQISGVTSQRQTLLSGSTKEEVHTSEAVSLDGLERLDSAATDKEETIAQGSPSDGEEILLSTGSDGEENISESRLRRVTFRRDVFLYEEESVPQAVWSFDEDRIFVSTFNNLLVVLRCSGDITIDDCQEVPRDLTNMTLCGDEGQYLVVCNSSNIQIYRHTDKPDRPLIADRYFSPDAACSDFGFDISPCNKFLVTVERSGVAGGIAIAESSFERLTCRESSEEAISWLRPSFDGRFVAIAKKREEKVLLEIWDALAANLLRVVEAASYVYDVEMAFSPESSLLGILSPIRSLRGTNRFEEIEVTFHKVGASEAVLPPLRPLKLSKEWAVDKIALSRNGRLLAIGYWQFGDEDTGHSEDEDDDTSSSCSCCKVRYISVWNVESRKCIMRQQILIGRGRNDCLDSDCNVENIWFSEDENTINVSLYRDRDFENGTFRVGEYETMTEEDEVGLRHNRDEHIYLVWCIASGELKSESRETCSRSSCYGLYEPFMRPRPGDLSMGINTRQITMCESDADGNCTDKQCLKRSALMTLDATPKGFWFDRERKRLWVIPYYRPLGILQLVGEKESVGKLKICVLAILLVPVAICMPLIVYILLLVRAFV